MNEPTNVKDAKSALRVEIRRRLKGITREQRAAASVLACRLISQRPVWREAGSLLCFAPRSDELNISPLVEAALESGKVVALPQYDPGARAYRGCQIMVPIPQLAVGAFGIREPGPHCASFPLNQLDLILVPGVAFDLSGRRLGRGKGYYDGLLAGVRAIKCGVCFDEQVQSEIPVESHDVLLECILTPTRWVECRSRRSGDDSIG